jgi:hypothetical protein
MFDFIKNLPVIRDYIRAREAKQKLNRFLDSDSDK